MALHAARSGPSLFSKQPLAACVQCLCLDNATTFVRSFSQASTSSEIYGACVLERLPIVQQPTPEWEAEYKTWARERRQQLNLFKQYPQPEGKKQSRGTDNPEDDFTPVPSVTQADKSGYAATMKRQLASKLVLLVKQNSIAGSSSSRSSGWTFPHARHEAGETIRATAERALRECIGVSQVYFIGNAPMAHLPLGAATTSSSSSTGTKAAAESGTSSSSTGSSSSSSSAETLSSSSSSSQSSSKNSSSSTSSGPIVFFHLAQVVNDPWEVAVKEGVASDHAWVTLEELPAYIKDARLLDLAKKML